MEDSGIDSEDTKFPITRSTPREELIKNIFSSLSDSEDDDDSSEDRSSTIGSTAPRMPLGPRDSRTLQRKLELRVQQARRSHAQQRIRVEEYNKKCSSALIPIQRLSIPGTCEQQPLVAWDTDDSDEEDIVSFFPVARTHTLSDTFSLQDFAADLADDTLEPEDDLELLPPQTATTPLPGMCCNKCLLM